MRTLPRAALAVCSLLALGACKVDVTVHVDVSEDGSGTVTLVAVADADVVAQAPGLAEDLQFDDAITAGWEVTGPAATDDGGLRVELKHDFATVEEATALLQSINGTGGPLHEFGVTRVATESQVTTFLSGTLRIDGDIAAFADSELLSAIGGTPYVDAIRADGLRPIDAVSFTLTADLPGDAVTSGSPTQWVSPLDGTSLEVETSSVLARGGSSIWSTVATIALVALVGWVIFAIGFIAFVAKARRRRSRPPTNQFRPRPLTRR